MRARVRAWLVGLIADGITEANRSQRIEINVDGKDVVTAIQKYSRQRGQRSAM